jgi:hypothetical protein
MKVLRFDYLCLSLCLSHNMGAVIPPPVSIGHLWDGALISDFLIDYPVALGNPKIKRAA